MLYIISSIRRLRMPLLQIFNHRGNNSSIVNNVAPDIFDKQKSWFNFDIFDDIFGKVLPEYPVKKPYNNFDIFKYRYKQLPPESTSEKVSEAIACYIDAMMPHKERIAEIVSKEIERL